MAGLAKHSGRKCNRGNVAIILALAAPALVGVAGLSVETGYWYYLQKKAQKAADISAYAGAVSLRNGEAQAAALDVALKEAALLGFAAPEVAVTPVSPPTSGPNQHGRAMQVTIDYEAPRFFSAIFDTAPILASVRAVAAYQQPANACVLALDGAAPGAITISGSADITLRSCEVMSNSIADSAVLLSGSSDVETDCVNAAGGVAIKSGSVDLTLTDCAVARENMPRAPDPYADVSEPTFSDLPCSSPGNGRRAAMIVSAGASGVKRFCGGLTLSGDYRFEPGVYVVDGGAFRINASSHVSGDGVTFFLTNGAEIRFNGAAMLDFSAPTRGTYAGIAFMGDRSDAGVEHRFNGTSDSLITGAIYTPASELIFSGNFSGENGCTQLVASTITLLGNMGFATDCTGRSLRWAQVPGAVRMLE
ncbi:MAG: pilus assembly protein TadG-related protein [Hyphomonadaceae bacterium]|nr:pilus assembly protein TadG-related protein [Hyphomonadaceae bacterium]